VTDTANDHVEGAKSDETRACGPRWEEIVVTVQMVPAHDGLQNGPVLLKRARHRCDPVLRAAVESLEAPLAKMAGYHLGWWDADGCAVSGGGGKSFRAALALGAAAACGDTESGVPAATAVELLHNFTLLHDDVMDGDETRRGRPTVWNLWGVANAILLGDALHALAIRVLAEMLGDAAGARAVARLEAACLTLCAGQFEDCAFETRQVVTVDEYLRMAGGKTAVLLGCACALGALAAGADDATVTAVDRFGYELGLAFQIVDDLLGIWGDPVVTGKPVGHDLARRKATLPVVVALNSVGAAAIELNELYRSGREMTGADVTRATELIEAAGGKDAAQRLADERLRAAMAALPDAVDFSELITLAHMATDRDR
jgi:geranylgeranyl diphosphate synthase type I